MRRGSEADAHAAKAHGTATTPSAQSYGGFGGVVVGAPVTETPVQEATDNADVHTEAVRPTLTKPTAEKV